MERVKTYATIVKDSEKRYYIHGFYSDGVFDPKLRQPERFLKKRYAIDAAEEWGFEVVTEKERLKMLQSNA
jgi:hypothetical protein